MAWPGRSLLTLIGAIDDATGHVPFALFGEQEDAQGYLLLLREVMRKRGVPLALYSDRHKIFQSESKEPLTLEEELAGKPPPTQVRRVLEELNIAWIGARSPQAKGRVLWGAFQDRLCQEPRLDGVTTLVEANATSRSPGAAQRTLPSAARSAWLSVPPSARRQTPPGRSSASATGAPSAWTTSSRSNYGRIIAIPPGPGRRSYARCRVEVREHLDGSASVHYQGACIARQRPQPGDLAPGTTASQANSLLHQHPSPGHPGPLAPSPGSHRQTTPWRRSLVTTATTSLADIAPPSPTPCPNNGAAPQFARGQRDLRIALAYYNRTEPGKRVGVVRRRQDISGQPRRGSGGEAESE